MNRSGADDHADGVEVPRVVALCWDEATRMHRRGGRLRTHSAQTDILKGCRKQHASVDLCLQIQRCYPPYAVTKLTVVFVPPGLVPAAVPPHLDL